MKRELIVKWKIREAETARILGLLPELVEKTRGEEGNIFYSIYQSEAEANVLILHECYADAKAAEAHRESEHFQRIVVGEIVPNLEVREITVVKPLL